MALGNARARNGGREWQASFLAIELRRNDLAYKVTNTRRADRKLLWLTGSNGELTLPFVQSYCYLEHVQRGRWQAVSEVDGRIMATGCSLIDVIGKTIRATYNVPTPWAATDFPSES
jgi:hypothetical protein